MDPKYYDYSDDDLADLYFALRSRVLTDAEMEIVEHYGDRLIVRPRQQFDQREVEERLNAALLQQFKMRCMKLEAEAVILRGMMPEQKQRS